MHAGASGQQGPAPGWLALRQLVGQPVQPIIQTRALGGTGGLDVPLWGEGKKGVRSREEKEMPLFPAWPGAPLGEAGPHRAAAQVL